MSLSTWIDAGLSAQDQVRQQGTDVAGFDVSSELYKKKVEVLRQEFGNNWLSALGHESWETPISDFPDGAYSSPGPKPSLPRTPSQGIVSAGRTLG
jgi:hypothetical protein